MNCKNREHVYLFQKCLFGSYLFLCHHWWWLCKFLLSSVKTGEETVQHRECRFVNFEHTMRTALGKNKNIVFSATVCSYLFNWQFTDSWSQVRFYIRDDLRVFSKPVKHWFLLQVSNLLKSIKIAYYYFRKTGSEVLLSHTHFIFYTIHRTMQIQMTSDVLYIKSCLCGSLGRARDVDEAFERQRKQMPAANRLKWKTNLLNVNALVLLFSEYKNNTNRRKW